LISGLAITPDLSRQVGDHMTELKREQVQTPAPQISVDNTQLLCQNCPTEIVFKRYGTDPAVWVNQNKDLTQILKQIDRRNTKCGGVGTLRSVLAYIAQNYPNMYPSEVEIADRLGLSRSTVQECIKALLLHGLLSVVERRPRNIKVFGLPMWERSYCLEPDHTPEPAPAPAPGLEPDHTPDRHSGHKQNRNKIISETHHSDVAYQLNEKIYMVAIAPLTPALRPDYSNKVKKLFTATMERMPAWRSDPKQYGNQLLIEMGQSVSTPGGVVMAMERLLEQAKNYRPQVREPAKVHSEPVDLERSYQVCQPIYEALMQQLKPQQYLGDYSPRALSMISKIIKVRPELATDLEQFADQLNEVTNTKDEQGTLMGLTNLAHSLS